MSIGAYLALDVLATLGTLVAVGFFVRVWLRSRAPLHLLLALGFLLLAMSYPFISTTHLGTLAGSAPELARFAGQTGGAAVLAFAYLASHGGRAASPMLVLGWSAGATALLALAFGVAALPLARSPSLQGVALVAHVLQTFCFAACAVLSSSGFRRWPTVDRALVPAAFVLWAGAKAAWIALDVGAPGALLPVVYLLRLAAVALLVVALALPILPPHDRLRPDQEREGA